jgi:hypothetical protein
VTRLSADVLQLLITPLVATHGRWPLVISLWSLTYIWIWPLLFHAAEPVLGAGLRAGRHSPTVLRQDCYDDHFVWEAPRQNGRIFL